MRAGFYGSHTAVYISCRGVGLAAGIIVGSEGFNSDYRHCAKSSFGECPAGIRGLADPIGGKRQLFFAGMHRVRINCRSCGGGFGFWAIVCYTMIL